MANQGQGPPPAAEIRGAALQHAVVQQQNPNQAIAGQGGVLQQPVQQNPEAQVVQQENPKAQNQATASQGQQLKQSKSRKRRRRKKANRSQTSNQGASSGTKHQQTSGATASMHDVPGLSKSESIELYSPVYAEKKPSDQPTFIASPRSSVKLHTAAAGKGKDSGSASYSMARDGAKTDLAVSDSNMSVLSNKGGMDQPTFNFRYKTTRFHLKIQYDGGINIEARDAADAWELQTRFNEDTVSYVRALISKGFKVLTVGAVGLVLKNKLGATVNPLGPGCTIFEVMIPSDAGEDFRKFVSSGGLTQIVQTEFQNIEDRISQILAGEWKDVKATYMDVLLQLKNVRIKQVTLRTGREATEAFEHMCSALKNEEKKDQPISSASPRSSPSAKPRGPPAGEGNDSGSASYLMAGDGAKIDLTVINKDISVLANTGDAAFSRSGQGSSNVTSVRESYIAMNSQGSSTIASGDRSQVIFQGPVNFNSGPDNGGALQQPVKQNPEAQVVQQDNPEAQNRATASQGGMDQSTFNFRYETTRFHLKIQYDGGINIEARDAANAWELQTRFKEDTVSYVRALISKGFKVLTVGAVALILKNKLGITANPVGPGSTIFEVMIPSDAGEDFRKFVFSGGLTQIVQTEFQNIEERISQILAGEWKDVKATYMDVLLQLKNVRIKQVTLCTGKEATEAFEQMCIALKNEEKKGAAASKHDVPGLSKSESIEHYSPVYAEKKPSDQLTFIDSPRSSVKLRTAAAGEGKDSDQPTFIDSPRSSVKLHTAAAGKGKDSDQPTFIDSPRSSVKLRTAAAGKGKDSDQPTFIASPRSSVKLHTAAAGKGKDSGGSSRSDDFEDYPEVYRREEPSGTQRMSIQDINSSPHAKKFVNYHNEKSWKKTNVRITESYEEQKLHESIFEVNPQLRKVERFYKKEAGFAYTAEEENLGKVITPGEVVEQLSKPDCRYMAIIGQAGSGKTTITKRLTRLIIAENRLVDEAGTLSSSHNPKFKFVHHINIKNIPFFKATSSEEAIDPCTLLFGNTGLTRQEMEEGFKWVQQNQAVLAFALDGLDRAPWNLKGKYNMMGYYDKSSTPTIIYNLIIGNLFPDATILISSHEHSIASLPYELQPQYIVSLAGLVRDDIEKLFIAVLGETGEESWRKLTVQSPALIPFSSVPICLIFNAIVHKFNPKNPPNTMTEMMIQILNIFMRSDNTQERSRIQKILHKLMKMSFEGTKEKRVIFTIDDLRKVGLEPEDVRDIIIKVPGNNMLSQHLMETGVIMSFSHEILQEVLSAFYIANMNLSTFRSFITEEIHNDHWSAVLRLLCGTVLNQSIDGKLIKDISKPYSKTYSTDTKEDEEEKKKLLQQTLETMFNRSRSYQQLELFGALYEANDDKLNRSLVRRIYISHTSLTTSGMYAISSVMRRCDQIEQVRLIKCDLNSELMQIMNSNLVDSCLKLDELDVKKNEELGTASGCSELGSVVSQCQVKKLDAEHCGITIDGIKALKENTRNAKLDELDVSWNKNLGSASGCGELGSVVSQCQVKKLNAGACDITIDGIKALKENTHNAKLDELNVSWSKDLGTASGCGELGSVVSQCQVKKLNAEGCDITIDGIKALKENTRNAKLDELNVRFNKNLGTASSCGELGSVVSQCQVKKLGAWDCDITIGGIKALKENTRNAKIKELDLRWNKVSKLGGDEGLSTISEIVHQCQVETLWMIFCDFNKDQLERFKASIADTGVHFYGD